MDYEEGGGVESSPLLTAEDVERISLPGKQLELVRGRLVVRDLPGTWHGVIAANLAYHLSDFVRRTGLGTVFAQDTGFKIASKPDTVRAPGVAFVARERAERIPRRGYAELAPHLLAEIVSPDLDRARSLPRSRTGLPPEGRSCGSSIRSVPRSAYTAATGV